MVPAYVVFASLMMLGTLISLSSSNMLLIWVGMEVNLMGAIPLFSAGHSKMKSVGCVKYFTWQAVGSTMLLLGLLISSLIFSMGLLVKLGAAPFQFWVPSVISQLSWVNIFLVSSWQKFAPLSLLLYSSSIIMQSVAVVSAIVGGLGGLNQTRLKGIVAYSSITHLGWMLYALTAEFSASVTYLLIYSVLLGSFIWTVLWGKSFSSNYFSWGAMLGLLTMAGLPPFTGFFIKLWLILIWPSMLVWGLILGSVISLVYYLNITLTIIPSLKSLKFSDWVVVIFNLMLLFFIWSLYTLYKKSLLPSLC